MKFGQRMEEDDPKVDLDGQGHRSKVKVTRVKKRNLEPQLTGLQVILKVRGHMGQGQRSHGYDPKVDLDVQGHRPKVKVTRSKLDRLTYTQRII